MALRFTRSPLRVPRAVHSCVCVAQPHRTYGPTRADVLLLVWPVPLLTNEVFCLGQSLEEWACGRSRDVTADPTPPLHGAT